MPEILLVAGGGHQAGLGHVARSLALAEAILAEDPAARVRFRIEGDAAARAMVSARGCSFDEGSHVDVAVIDLPRPDPEVYRRFREAGVPTVSIDDPGPARYHSDVALAMLYRPAAPRPADCRTRDLGGLGFAVLRPAFRRLPPRAFAAEAKTVLVCQGGSDTYGVTPKLCRALRAFPRIRVVLGPAFRHDAELRDAVGGDPRFELQRNPPAMDALMSDADLAVSAAGMTSLELAASGVPTLLVVTEPKERETAEALHAAGAAVFLGGPEVAEDGTLAREAAALAADPARRERLGRAAQALIDGDGARRAARAVLDAVRRRP
jgi:spore coat polysaccharide biosynthesis predicted glycosyltransferase SpsG